MIRRSSLSRAFGAVMALWFSVVATEPMPLHDCAMHPSHASHVAPAGSAARQASAHDPMGAMGEMGEMPADRGANDARALATHDHAPPNPPRGHTHCTCPGGCCATASVAPPRPAATTAVEVVAPAGTPLADAEGMHVDDAEFDHPFANGPPQAA